MTSIPDYTTDEIKIVSDTLAERYGKSVAVELADVELRLNPEDRTLTTCPALYWEDNECHFVVCKLGNNRFYCQFKREYHDLFDCVVTLLRVQADHQLKEQGVINSSDKP